MLSEERVFENYELQYIECLKSFYLLKEKLFCNQLFRKSKITLVSFVTNQHNIAIKPKNFPSFSIIIYL